MIRFVPMDDVRESTIRNVGTSAIISPFLNNEGTTQNETKRHSNIVAYPLECKNRHCGRRLHSFDTLSIQSIYIMNEELSRYQFPSSHQKEMRRRSRKLQSNTQNTQRQIFIRPHHQVCIHHGLPNRCGLFALTHTFAMKPTRWITAMGDTAQYGYGEDSAQYGYGDATPTAQYGCGEDTAQYGYEEATPAALCGYGEATPTDQYGYGEPTPAAQYGYGEATPMASSTTRMPRRSSLKSGSRAPRRA